MLITAQELCNLLGGELEGDPNVQIHGPGRIESASKGTLSFLANPKYEQYVYTTQASVLLVSRDFVPEKPVNATLIRVDDVYGSIGQLLQQFNDHEAPVSGISERAEIDPEAIMSATASVGAFSVVSKQAMIGEHTAIYPQVFVGAQARIGNHVTIYPGARIYHNCVIGDHCIIHANAVIGSDGFGFVRNKNGSYEKIAQIGNVVLENHVEIGANTVIDRATMGSTVIREGAKLDNLIQVAHNVEIGKNTAIAAQAGIAGSTRVGENVQIGGQAGIIGHIHIAAGTRIQAQSGVAASIEEEERAYYGSPAIEYRDYLKAYALFRQLPELKRRLEVLERDIKALMTPNKPKKG